MSNPTTPFNWQMPTNTDLVTDLPADFEVFGQAVATSMADLLGGTSGQILSKNSNTDMDFVWINNDQGDITGITATSPLTGGGTSGAVTVGIQSASTSQSGAVQLSDSTSTTSSVLAATSTAVKSAYDLATTANTAAGTAQTTANAAIPKSTVTTAGDVIYATGSSAVTRLGIGSSGQVLTVSGGVPTWATAASSGGMTLISTTSLTGATVTLNSFSGYVDLQLVVIGAYGSNQNTFRARFNSDTGSNYYEGQYASGNNGSANTSLILGDGTSSSSTNVNQRNFSVLKIQRYAQTHGKPFQVLSGYIYWSNNAVNYVSNSNSIYISTSAITSIDLFMASGSFSGGTAYLYGVK